METMQLSPVVLLGGIGMMLVALGFAAYAIVRRLGWRYLAFGALMWMITVAVKFALAVPFNAVIYHVLTKEIPGGVGALLFDLYVGLLTGLTEVLIVWLVMRLTRFGKVEWQRALAFGIGFGTFEALLLGLGSFATMLTAMVAPQSIPVEVMIGLRAADNWLFSLAPIVERFFTIWIHIFCNVLIFYAVVLKQMRGFWLAFVFKSLLDAWAAWGQLAGMTATVEQVWVLESVIVVMGAAAWWGTRWVSQHYPQPITEAKG